MRRMLSCEGAVGGLESVDFDLVLLADPGGAEKVADVVALIPLQLDHFAVLRMLNNGTIAGKFLFTYFGNLFQVILLS